MTGRPGSAPFRAEHSPGRPVDLRLRLADVGPRIPLRGMGAGTGLRLSPRPLHLFQPLARHARSGPAWCWDWIAAAPAAASRFGSLHSDVATSLEALWEREMSRGVYHPRLLRARLPRRWRACSRSSQTRCIRAMRERCRPSGPPNSLRTAAAPAGRTSSISRVPSDHLAELGVRDHNLRLRVTRKRCIAARMSAARRRYSDLAPEW